MANTTNWLNISSQSGSSGETILTLSAQRNLSTNYKTAEITAYNPVYNISAKTYVTIESYSPYIEVEPVIVGVPESGGTYQLSISSNCAYVIAYPDLVASYSTSAATGNTTITFSVTGTSADTTLVGNIVITDESGQVSKTVRVEQYGQGAQISYWPGYLNFPASGGSGNIGVSANCVYTVTKSEGADWFSVSPSSGYTGRTDFTVTMTGENTGSTPLSGYVFINGPGNAGGVVEIRQNAAETRLVVGYYVTSTTEPTVIMRNVAVSYITTAEYPNGTQITPATAYTFPSTGMQYVYYTVSQNAVPDRFLDAGGSYTALSGTVRSVFIPNSYTGIGKESFYKCSSLSSVTLGNGITIIDNYAFEGCTGLSSITLPESLQTIGTWCFVDCANLTEIVIPSAVTNIGADCFMRSSVETFYFSSPTPPTLGDTSALTSSNLQEIIVPCVYYNDYVTAWPQYEQYMTCQDTELYFITDTSNVKGIGETRTITILNTNINPNRTGLNLPSDFPAQGSYVVDGNTIYLTYPRNPSTSSTRTWTIGVLAQTNDGVSLSGSYRITQDANTIYSIPYTADTSTVAATGETRTITIDTSNLVASSITIGIQGATGVTYTYQNGVITITFPENTGDGPGSARHITVTINATTLNGYEAYASINYTQNYKYTGEKRFYVVYDASSTNDVKLWNSMYWTKIELADGTDISSAITSNTYCFGVDGYVGIYITPTNGLSPGAFYDCNDIVYVGIPNNITSIPNQAFYSMNSTSPGPPQWYDVIINFGSSVQSIGDEALYFSNFSKLFFNSPTGLDVQHYESIIYDIKTGGTLFYPCGADYSEIENGLVNDFNWSSVCFSDSATPSTSESYRIYVDGNIRSLEESAETRTFKIGGILGTNPSITYSVSGASDITYTYTGDTITVMFPRNESSNFRNITISATASTYNGLLVGTGSVSIQQLGNAWTEVVYDVASTSSATKVLGSEGYGLLGRFPNGIESDMYHNTSYTFSSSGLQTVYYFVTNQYYPYRWEGRLNNVPTVKSVSYSPTITGITGDCRDCSGLTGVVIPSSVTVVAANRAGGTPSSAFYNCQNLSFIQCNAVTAPSLQINGVNSYLFKNISETGVLKYPAGSDYSSWLRALPSGWTGQTFTP